MLCIIDLHTVGVAGSNPVAPTIRKPGQKLIRFWLFVYRVTLLDFALILLNVL